MSRDITYVQKEDLWVEWTLDLQDTSDNYLPLRTLPTDRDCMGLWGVFSVVSNLTVEYKCTVAKQTL